MFTLKHNLSVEPAVKTLKILVSGGFPHFGPKTFKNCRFQKFVLLLKAQSTRLAWSTAYPAHGSTAVKL